MIEYLVILGFGVVTGIFTGLIPGVHPNTVVFTTLPFYFSYEIGLLPYMSFLSGLSVSHTFHDFLPAIFLGAPEAESALSSLPGAKMAVRGRGLEAFDYTVAGGMFSVLALIFVVPFLLLLLESVYGFIERVMAFVLLFFLFFIVFRSDTWITALTVALLAGLLGTFSFSANVNQEFVLIPVFSGLFAIPSIIHALKSGFRIPGQRRVPVSPGKSFRGGLVGFFAGLMAGVFPGLGAAVSTSFLSPLLSSRKEFLAGMGGVNTSDILVSFIALHILGKARSGASVALKSISTTGAFEIVFLIGLSLVAVSVSLVSARWTSRLFVSFIRSYRLEYLLLAVSAVIVFSTVWLTGLQGLLVLSTASFIGYAALIESERAACMAVLLVPAISFYWSSGIFI